MNKCLRLLRFCPWSVLLIVGLGGALFGYYVYTPAPEIPQPSDALTKGPIEFGGLKQTDTTYVPRGLAKGAPASLLDSLGEQNDSPDRLRRVR